MKKNYVLRKLFCFALVFTFSLSCFMPVGNISFTTANAAWDGYTGDANLPQSFSLINLSSIKNIIDAGVKPSKKYATDGNLYSAHWNNHTANNHFRVRNFDASIPKDWSKYSEITLKIYSEKATGAKMFFGIFNDNAPDGVRNFGTYFFVDWEGWKEISYKFSDLSRTRNPSLINIKMLRIVANGDYKLTGDPETDLYISSVVVGGYKDGYDFVSDFYGKEKISGALDSLENSVAVYAGGANAVTKSGAKKSDYSFGCINNKVTVPAKFFSDFFGAVVSDNGKQYSISLGDAHISGKSESREVIISNNKINMTIPAYTSDNMCYVPAEEIAKLLSLESLTDGKLLVVGTDAAVSALRRPGNLGVNEYNEIVAYKALTNPVNKDDFTVKDCEAVRKNWREYLVGSETLNDLTQKEIVKKIENVTSLAKEAQKNLIRDNPSTEIFSNINSKASADMTTAYRTVENMALAYATYGSELYQNKELLDDIIYALDWLYENRYSASGKAKWKFSGFSNWHDWDISTPEALVHILLCIEDKISSKDITKYLSYFDETNPVATSTGANFCHFSEVILGSAMLQNDYEKALRILVAMQKEYLYVDDNERIVESQLVERSFEVPTKGAGFFTDGSYVFHTLHAMNGAYGSSHYSAIMRIQQQIAGTKFDLEFPAKSNLISFWKDSFDTIIFETTIFRAVMGRNQNPNNSVLASTPLLNAYRLAVSLTDEQTKNELYSIIKAAYLPSSDMFKNTMTDSLSIGELKEFNSIMEDETIIPRQNRRVSTMFYNMDKSFHIRNDWAAGVSMSSSRIFNYESINSANLDGWYLGDGRTEYYLSGSNMNGTSQYWASMDKYRMPGTTVDTQERKKVSVDQGNEYLSSKDFVGGVVLGGQYSASAMELESYHNDTPFGKDTAYGDPNPAHKNDLTAKKSYFMLDDGIICLGSAVNAKNNNNAEVLTIVDNPLAVKTQTISDISIKPYTIKSVVASHTPEAENIAANTIDGSLSTKWAGEAGNEIIWDMGEIKPLGFANISLLNGAVRQQYLELHVSEDGKNWTLVFDGASSGKKDNDEAFDLKNINARYLKYVNKGNSAGSVWVSITECSIYPPNPDGTIGIKEPVIYGADPISVDGKEINLTNDDALVDGAKWINFNNQVGYYFPENASLNAGQLKCRWSKNIMPHFELWFSHGINPTNGGYAYVLLPGKTNDETAAFSQSGNITVLANTPEIQAARDNRTGITYYVFWKEASFGDITVTKPCMVITRESKDGFEIAVSDPTQKLTENTVTINKSLGCISGDEYASVTSDISSTTIKLNMKDSVGRTFEFTMVKK